eukprot:s2777_g5.t1
MFFPGCGVKTKQRPSKTLKVLWADEYPTTDWRRELRRGDCRILPAPAILLPQTWIASTGSQHFPSVSLFFTPLSILFLAMSLMSSTVYSPVPTNCPQDERSNSKDSEGSKMGEPYPPCRTMLMASDERLYMSSWLSKVEGFPCGASIKETYHGICIVISIFSDMPSRHLMHFLFVLISYVLVVLTGAVQMKLVDTSFFRAVGLLLAVLLSLRAKNAVSRRQKLMAGVLDMMNCAKNLLYLIHFNPQNRSKLRSVLEFVFLEAAAWALPAMKPGEDVADLNDLPEEYREVAFVLRAKYAAHISPRPLLLWLRELCDELFDPELATKSAGPEKMDQISIISRFHLNAEEELHTLFAKFDFLLMFREKFVTDQFRWMLETVIFIYLVLYPWCVGNESNLVLGATTAAWLR